jgi:redox-sensitive bicupin YhaK (pirin superfamily)
VGLVVLSPQDYRVLDEDDFGVPGLVAHEIIGPFVKLRSLGPLIMVHDGVFEPHHGIGHHPHRFNERLFYILEGAVDHDDALNGITGHMGTGDLGRLTEGNRGMLHKEWNNTDGRARAFILVYETDPTPPEASFEALRDADAPRYEESAGVTTKELVGPVARLPINGDIRLFTDSRVEAGGELTVEFGPKEGGLLFPVVGEMQVWNENRESLPMGQTAVFPPADTARSVRVGTTGGGRVLRVVHGPGRGLPLS